MKERPILFSAPMVRGLLADTKTQTRRIAKSKWAGCHLEMVDGALEVVNTKEPEARAKLVCPYCQPGDRLWVRETWQRFSDDGEILFKADPQSFAAMNDLKRDECLEAKWRPSIFMPRWASRITLEVTSVRAERLQDISEADAKAEGADPLSVAGFSTDDLTFIDAPLMDPNSPYKNGFASLWESINGEGSWKANPWVWVVEFHQVMPWPAISRKAPDQDHSTHELRNL